MISVADVEETSGSRTSLLLLLRLMDDFGGRLTRALESRVNGKRNPWTRAVSGSESQGKTIKKCVKLM